MRADTDATDVLPPAPPPPQPVPPPPPPQLPPADLPSVLFDPRVNWPPELPPFVEPPPELPQPAAVPLPAGVDDPVTANTLPDVPGEPPIPEGEDREDTRTLQSGVGSLWFVLLRYLHAPITKTNVRALNAWADSEGMPPIANNPLAIRRVTLDSKPYPPAPQIQMYPTAQEGAYATSRTMLATADSKIVAALREGKSLNRIYNAVNQSGWRPGAQNGHYPVVLYNLVYGNVAPKDDSGPVQKPIVPPAKIGQSSTAWRNLMAFYSKGWPDAGRRASTVAKDMLKGVK